MFCLRRPTEEVLNGWLEARLTADVFTTCVTIPDPPPRGFRINRTRVKLGEGETVFQWRRILWE